MGKKPFRKKSVGQIRGSLARRVFALSFLLVVLPLILHSIFSYRTQYESRLKDLFVSMNLIGGASVQSLEQQIKLYEAIMDSAGKDFITMERPEQIDLVKSIGRGTRQDVFVLQAVGSKLICTISSNEHQVGKDYANIGSFRHIFKDEFTVFAFDDPYLKKREIFITHVINEREVLCFAFSALKFLQEMKEPADPSYPVNLSFVLLDGEVIASTDPTMVSHYLYQLSPKRLDFPDAFEMQRGEIKEYGMVHSFPGTEFLLLLNIPEYAIRDLQKKVYIDHIVFLLGFILMLGGGCAVLFAWRLSKPLRKLYRTMQVVSEEKDYSQRYEKDLMGFEINILGERFNEMIESVLKHQNEVQEERVQKEKLAQEFTIASQIQKGLLPCKIPNICCLDISAGFRPAKEVGGDFYDLFIHPGKNHLVIVIADAAGKGLPACLFSLGFRSIFRAFSQTSCGLQKIIHETNLLFFEDTKDSGNFVTAWFGFLDLNTFNLTYASAGHFPALLKKKDEILELKTDGMALGVVSDMQWETQTYQMSEEDMLFLFTDGAVEVFDNERKMYGFDRLKKFVRETENIPDTFVKKLFDDLDQFSKGRPQDDDLTILSIKRISKHPCSPDCQIPSGVGPKGGLS